MENRKIKHKVIFDRVPKDLHDPIGYYLLTLVIVGVLSGKGMLILPQLLWNRNTFVPGFSYTTKKKELNTLCKNF